MRLIAVIVLLLAACLADAPAEVLSFTSYAPASERPLLTRTDPRQPATISGTLLLPTQASRYERNGKLPAVIIMHGTGGILRDREPQWALRFNDWGIAAFYVDSFAARGVRPPLYAGSSQYIPSVAQVVDAHHALEALARYPRIDKSRVVVMGFSRGGEVALSSMFDRFRRGSLDDPSLCFAGHLALYPSCAMHYRGKEVTSAPRLMLPGGADDMTSPTSCQHQADWLAECRYHGAHVGGDAAALRGSIEEVRQFLARVF